MSEHSIYRGLKYFNDAKAIGRAAAKGSVHPVVRRAGRRVYGKVAGRLAKALFR